MWFIHRCTWASKFNQMTGLKWFAAELESQFDCHGELVALENQKSSHIFVTFSRIQRNIWVRCVCFVVLGHIGTVFAKQFFNSNWVYCILTHFQLKNFDLLSFKQKDTYEAINAVKNVGGDGVVLWGSSFDLNTKWVSKHAFLKIYNKISKLFSHFQIFTDLAGQNVFNSITTWKMFSDRSLNHSSHDTSWMAFFKMRGSKLVFLIHVLTFDKNKIISKTPTFGVDTYTHIIFKPTRGNLVHHPHISHNLFWFCTNSYKLSKLKNRTNLRSSHIYWKKFKFKMLKT